MVAGYGHEMLVTAAKDYLAGIGATDIVTEHPVVIVNELGASQNIYVDVAALTKQGETLAVECGRRSVMHKRFSYLSKKFDIVLWVPQLPLLFSLVSKELSFRRRDLEGLTSECLRCGHVWLPRVPNPQRCPQCLSRYWRTARKVKEVNKEDKAA